MKAELKDDSRKRLARIAGQVNGLQKMVESDRSCNDILQQIVAARAALDQLGISFLTEHLQSCVLHQDVTNEDECCTHLPENKWPEEIKTSLSRFLR
jgi:DNA-binding FrmR family transcriptional regulator